MTSCQACGTDIIGKDRFCRNCGAPVAVSVGDMVDTSRFAHENANPDTIVRREPTNPFYTPPSAGYPSATGSAATYSTGSFLKALIQRKATWLVLLFVLFGASVIGAGALFLARSGSRTIDSITSDRADAAFEARRAYEEAVQNSLGFKQGRMSDAEFPDVKGIFVNSLMSDDCPAALAKVQAGDVLMELNAQPVRNDTELAQALAPLTPGQEVAIKLYRDGETIATKLKIADRSFPPLQPKFEPRDQGFLGIKDANRRCCIPGTKKWGVEVIRTHYNAPAEIFGLQPGDVITQFDGRATRTTSEFNRLIRATRPRSKVLVKFFRGASEQSTEVIVGHRW